MNEISIAKYITDTSPGVATADNFGYTFFFYAADDKLPFATIAHNGNEYERISRLDRPGVFRLNISVSKNTFQALFGDAKVDVRASTTQP